MTRHLSNIEQYVHWVTNKKIWGVALLASTSVMQITMLWWELLLPSGLCRYAFSWIAKWQFVQATWSCRLIMYFFSFKKFPCWPCNPICKNKKQSYIFKTQVLASWYSRCLKPSYLSVMQTGFELWTWLKPERNGNGLMNGPAQFYWKLYSTIVDLFCRYKSDNNINTPYINHLQRCPQSLVSQDIYLILLCLASSQLFCMYQSSGPA